MSDIFDQPERGLGVRGLESQLKFLSGDILTIIDASLHDVIQRDAVKSLIKDTFRRQTDYIKELCGSYLVTYDAKSPYNRAQGVQGPECADPNKAASKVTLIAKAEGSLDDLESILPDTQEFLDSNDDADEYPPLSEYPPSGVTGMVNVAIKHANAPPSEIALKQVKKTPVRRIKSENAKEEHDQHFFDKMF